MEHRKLTEEELAEITARASEIAATPEFQAKMKRRIDAINKGIRERKRKNLLAWERIRHRRIGPII